MRDVLPRPETRTDVVLFHLTWAVHAVIEGEELAVCCGQAPVAREAKRTSARGPVGVSFGKLHPL